MAGRRVQARNVYEGTDNRTTISNLSRSRLAELLFPHPPADEQYETVAILDSIDQKMELHRRKHAILEELFGALLHKLMTGEIRVGTFTSNCHIVERSPQS